MARPTESEHGNCYKRFRLGLLWSTIVSGLLGVVMLILGLLSII